MLKVGEWRYYRDSSGDLSPCKIVDTEIHDNFIRAKVGLLCFWYTKRIRQDDLQWRMIRKPWWCWF